jgi:tRNA threonylcarbamoyladenosine biosynthesis protein TsaE
VTEHVATETVTASAAETEAAGRAFGARLRVGDVVFLVGELGAGKTTFVRGVAAACGTASRVRSPTFALMHRYRGTPEIVHIDLYRQTDDAGLDDLAVEEWQHEVVTLVEWPRSFAEEFWPHAIRVELEHRTETERMIRIFRTSDDSPRFLS